MANSPDVKKTVSPGKDWSLLICLLLALITLAVYYQVHSFGFVNLDDPLYVYQNPSIQHGLTLKAIKWAFISGSYADFWHPLTWLSHMLDWQLYGSNAGGHHITNLIFHIVNTLLVFIILKMMTRAFWQSAFVAVLFALHPLHVEVVVWVAERKEVLGTFFWLLTMWAYVRFIGRPKPGNYLLIVVLFALGLMAKPMLVTLPFVFLLLDYWPFRRKISRRLLIEKIPFFILSITASVIAFFAQRSGGALAGLAGLSLKVRVCNALISYVKYIIKMVWPAGLTLYYPHPLQNVSILYAVISAGILLIITIFVLRFAKKRPYLFTGWFWYLGTLVPVIGLVQVGSHAMADRYTYITLTGLFIVIAWGIPELLSQWRYKKIALTLSAVLVITVLMVCTYFQIRYWRNNEILFQHALDVTKNSHIAHFCISAPLREQGRLDEAIYHCSQTIRIKPDALDARIQLAYLLQQTGKLSEAAEEYKKCLQMKPDDPNSLNGLGIILGRQGKLDQAVKYLTDAVRIKPDYTEARTNLGFALILQGNPDEAAVHLTQAIRLSPDSALAHYYLGKVLSQKDKINGAVEHFEYALRLKPDWVEPMNELAWYLAAAGKDFTIRNPDRAVKLANRACELTDYKNPQFLDTLSVAYAATDDYEKAVETAQKAMDLCRQPSEREQISNHLILFKAGKPYIIGEKQ